MLFPLLLPMGILAIALPLILWPAILGKAAAQIGFAPLGFGYIAFGLGWMGSAFLVATAVVAPMESSIQSPGVFWGWFGAVFILGAPIALLALGIFGVPVAALLVRSNRLSYRLGLALLVAFLVAGTAASWLVSHDPWTTEHAVESFVRDLTHFAMYVLPAGTAGVLGLTFAVDRRQRGLPLAPPWF